MTEPLILDASELPVRLGTGTCFGTFGELIQGVSSEEGDFLVTLPIDCWSTATVRLTNGPRRVDVTPQHKVKSRLLVDAMLARCGWDGRAEVTISSGLPEGKGLGSSSADLVAVARVVAYALCVDLPPAHIEALLRDIEPTDGVMHPGIVVFDHRGVRLLRQLGSPQPMTVVGIDEGGSVDTVDFNRIPKPFTPAEQRTYADLLRQTAIAVQGRGLAALGRIATSSSLMNQKLRPKHTLHAMIRICEEAGALGVVAAHSGTVLGILVAGNDPKHDEKLAYLQLSCRDLAGAVMVQCTLCFDDASRREG